MGPFFKLSKVSQRGTKTIQKAIESLKGFQIYENQKSTPSKGRKFLKFEPKFENFGWNFGKIVSLRVVKTSKNGENFRNSVSLRVDFRTLARTYPLSRKPSTPPGYCERKTAYVFWKKIVYVFMYFGRKMSIYQRRKALKIKGNYSHFYSKQIQQIDVITLWWKYGLFS